MFDLSQGSRQIVIIQHVLAPFGRRVLWGLSRHYIRYFFCGAAVIEVGDVGRFVC